MARIIVPNEALINWANAQIDDLPTLTDCHLRLYSGTLEIDRYTTLSALEAAQVSFSGYEPKQLENWSEAVIIDDAAMTEADAVSFTSETDLPDEVINGCYATNADGIKLWFASEFDDAVPIPYQVELQIIISMNLRSIFNSEA